MFEQFQPVEQQQTMQMQDIMAGIHASTLILSTVCLLIVAVCLSSHLRKAIIALLKTPFAVVSNLSQIAYNLFVPAFISEKIHQKIESIDEAYVSSYLQKRTANNPNPLINGDLNAAREMLYPASKYKWLHEEIPVDVRRSVIVDGRLLDGRPVTWLSWHHLNAEVVSFIARNELHKTVKFVKCFALAAFVVSVIRAGGGVYARKTGLANATSYAGDTVYVFDMMLDFALRVTTSSLFIAFVAAAMFTPVFYFSFFNSVKRYMKTASAPLATPTRDSLMAWKNHASQREVEMKAYARHVELAKQSSSIKLGLATGTARAHGATRAPCINLPVCVDTVSIRQHMIAFGGTGEGKTKVFLKPVTQRVFEEFAKENKQLGAYVTDGKGVLWKDIIQLPAISARSEDIRVLGVGEGRYGVNLVAGMTALEIAEMFSTVSSSTVSDKDKFWLEQASQLLMHAATAALAVQKLRDLHYITNRAEVVVNKKSDEYEAGIVQHLEKQKVDDDAEVTAKDIACLLPLFDKADPFSLLSIYKIAINDKMRDAVSKLIEVLTVVYEDNEEASAELNSVFDSQIIDALAYFVQFDALAVETSGSIIANLNVSLGKFSGAPDLAERFGNGALDSSEICDVDEALSGKIVCVSVGESEFGQVGSLVATWLKTRLYAAARRRENVDPVAAARDSVVVIADEFQLLATTVGTNSDSEFFNVARSTGVFMIAATQSMPSLQKRLGDTRTLDLLSNMRTKVMLRNEDEKTLAFFSKLAGKTQRGLITSDDYYETQGQRELFINDYPVDPAKCVSKRTSLLDILPRLPKIEVTPQRKLVSFDNRFILNLRKGGDGSNPTAHLDAVAKAGNIDAVTSSKQAATWRQEDKEKDAKTAGYQERDLFSADDIQVGGGQALVIAQRAGVSIVDIVDLAA